MRMLYVQLKGDMNSILSSYAKAEARGEITRKSNKHGINAEVMRVHFSVMGSEKGGYIQTDGRKCCFLQRNNFERTVNTKLKYPKMHFVHIEVRLNKE